MLLTKSNVKTAIIGTTVLSLLATVIPEIAQAANFRATLTVQNQLGSTNKSQFIIRTGISADDPNEIPVFYLNGIGNFKITQDAVPIYDLKNTSLDLEASRLGSLSEILQRGFSELRFTSYQEEPYYQYNFFIPNYQSIPISGLAPFGQNGTISFYVPSKFIYRDLSLIDFKTNANPDNKLLKSLSGFNEILNLARAKYTSILFPTNVVNEKGELVGLEIETNPIPEPNTVIGLMSLGLVGGVILLKRNLKKCD